MCWACDQPGADRRAYLDHIRRAITRHGWAVQYVGGDRSHAPYAYTVGLTGAGMPELVVTGLRAQRATTMLNDAARDMLAAEPPSPGSMIALPDGRRVEVVRLRRPESHLAVALDLYGDEVRALQLVWADDRGRLPWHPVFRSNRGGQPVLGPRALAAS
jgi:hypothetical protein